MLRPDYTDAAQLRTASAIPFVYRYRSTEFSALSSQWVFIDMLLV